MINPLVPTKPHDKHIGRPVLLAVVLEGDAAVKAAVLQVDNKPALAINFIADRKRQGR